MDLLNAIKWTMISGPALQDVVTWADAKARIVNLCGLVSPHRLPYVLSTGVCLGALYPSMSRTLLMFVVYDPGFTKWLIGQGVCPNVGTWHDTTYLGWQAGPVHPGRPQPYLLVMDRVRYRCTESVALLLLAVGAYPTKPYSRHAPRALGHWQRWHARVARRLWLHLYHPSLCHRATLQDTQTFHVLHSWHLSMLAPGGVF